MEPKEFQEKVKVSFSNAKKEINDLKEELNLIKKDFYALKEEISKIISLIEEKRRISKEIGQETDPIISYANKHANMQINMQTNKHTLNTQINTQSVTQLDQIFLKLAKKEFLFFLTVYQLEEDIGQPVTYARVANHLKITEGGVRTYLHNVVKKGAPIEKIKLNNKLVVLTINKEFKNLKLKTRLIDLYSHLDSEQTRLTDM